MKFFLLTLIFLFINTVLFTQSDSSYFKGNVFDSQTNEPLPFSNISVVGKNVGTTTNEFGEFKLLNISKKDRMVISYVGYKSTFIELTNIDLMKTHFIYLQPINIDMQEITVYSNTLSMSEKMQTSNLSLQSEQIREIASAMPDILRSVQAFPGVVVNNEFKADFNVRGGNQDENLVLVNGTRVYEPFHIKEASNASVGIFNIDLMKKVNIVTGGFPAKYGDKMSSVLNIEYREGSREKYSGAASLSLAYFDGYAEGPLGENGSFIFGARKSYLEYIISMIDYEDISRAQPSFYDVQGVLAFNLSPKNKLLFEFIYANDDFTYDPERIYSDKIENEDNIANYTSTLFSLKSKNILSSKALLNAEVNYYDQGDNEYRLFLRDYKTLDRFLERLTYDTLKIKTIEFNTNIQYQFNSDYEIQLGLSYHNISYNQISDDLWTIDNDFTYQGEFGDGSINAESFKYTGFVENIFSMTEQLTFNLGGRFDYFDINKDFNVSPRVNLAYRFKDKTVLKAAWGYFYQSPIYDQLKYSESSDTNTQSQKAIHYILGIEKSIPFSNNKSFLNIRLEAYYKEYDDIISSYYGVFERLTYSRENDAIGNATGLDIYTVLSLPGFYSWISYGLLFANENLNDDNIGEYRRYTDQRHTISFVSNLELGNDWRFSLKANYGSGFPYTPKTPVKNENGIWVWKSGKINSASLPAYKRVDIRLSKLFKFTGFNLSTFIDISNVFNFENVQQFEYSSTPDIYEPKPEKILLWPIVPSLGLRFEF